MDVDAEDVLELATADDQQPVEALAADAADPALHVSVRIRRPDRCADDLDLRARNERVERTWELGVAVVDREPNLPVMVIELPE